MQIGQYALGEELGRGTLGTVYRGSDAQGRALALRVIRLADFTEWMPAEALAAAVVEAAEDARSLLHPCLASVEGVSGEPGTALVATEFLQGAPLRYAQRDPEAVAMLLEPLAEALDYAHAEGVLHGHLHPGEIFTEDGLRAKLTGFGMPLLDLQQGGLRAAAFYASPERLEGRTSGGAADQFSLAAICYELLTGERPFAGDRPTALAFQVLWRNPDAASLRNPELSERTDAVLARAMAKGAPDRFASCVEFVHALGASLQRAPVWDPPPQPLHAPQVEPIVIEAPLLVAAPFLDVESVPVRDDVPDEQREAVELPRPVWDLPGAKAPEKDSRAILIAAGIAAGMGLALWLLSR